MSIYTNTNLNSNAAQSLQTCTTVNRAIPHVLRQNSIWFEAGSKAVADRFEAGSKLDADLQRAEIWRII